LISPDGGIHRRHQNWPRPGAKRKESRLLYNSPAKELEERKRFGIAAAAREILKEMLSLPLYMYQEQRTPNIPGLVHIQDIEEVNASVNADESVEVNSQVSMICLLFGSSKTKSNTMRIFESNN
jgi:hypothetical protein